jgi:hypothetical protein
MKGVIIMSAHSEAANGFVVSDKARLMLNTVSHETRAKILCQAYELIEKLEGDGTLTDAENSAANMVYGFAVEIAKALKKRQEQSKNARAVHRENISRPSHDSLTTSQEESEEEKSSPTPSSKEEVKEESSLIKRVRKVFAPPSVEEVRAYCTERNNGINAEEFVDFYTGKGWMVGKNKMVDWRASVRTWERSRNASNRFGNGAGNGIPQQGRRFRTVTTAGNFRAGNEAQRAEASAVL